MHYMQLKNGRRELFVFDSLDEVTRTAKGRSSKPENVSMLRIKQMPIERHDKFDTLEFFGFRRQAELDKEIRLGWPAGADVLAKAAESLGELPDVKTTSTVKRRKRCRADEGDEIDMDRVRAGRLDIAWETRKRMNRQHKSATIVCSIGGSAALSASDLMWRGACAVVLAEAYERAGYATEVYAVRTTGNFYENDYNMASTWAIRVKDTHTKLDRGSLAIATALGGWYRTTMFAAMTATGTRQVRYGMGASVDTPESVLREGLNLTDELVVIPFDLFSRGAAERFLSSAIATPAAVQH